MSSQSTNCVTNGGPKINGPSTLPPITSTITTNGHVHPNLQQHSQRTNDVGILALEMYFPSVYVDQTELEKYDGVSEGKYTIGLGQTRMGFCSDREDIQSLCLTVTHRLFEKTGVSPKDIGFLMVGTETLVDKSKSVKSVLMQLFEESGNGDVEGVDTTNACYGGTAALFAAVNWIESSSWDGRYALVVAGDIAIYASGSARPTGGAGAVAMLVGPNAPLSFVRGARATHMAHTYDFYKPHMDSEYPVVEGKQSIICYTQAVDRCYQLFTSKYENVLRKEAASANAVVAGQVKSVNGGLNGDVKSPKLIDSKLDVKMRLQDFDGLLFHSPYCKLVQKSVARLSLNEFLREDNPDYDGYHKGCEKFRKIKLEETYFDRDLEKHFISQSSELFKQKTQSSLLLATQVGNMYTASLYSCLVSYFLSKPLEDIAGKRILLFSYGSGMAASMFCLQISPDVSTNSPLERLYNGIKDVSVQLKRRNKIAPASFVETLKLREETHHLCPYTPKGPIDNLFPGTYYLDKIDNLFRREYKRVPVSSCIDKDLSPTNSTSSSTTQSPASPIS
ncbi:hydroxymethylglutaryl-CoA synthase 1 [Tetranychus urticae]|uniref:Hydroxymethylglutaryl-CoA synthase n=1 Tax=Tetranychus urticae TaxID=32264 RepID=T1JY71_TETUR|nr:hydroxymethylglutaryl-CoA synthase 1 [Tetranychus urticae]